MNGRKIKHYLILNFRDEIIKLLANWVLKDTNGDEKALQRVLSARAGGKWEGATPVRRNCSNIIQTNHL